MHDYVLIYSRQSRQYIVCATFTHLHLIFSLSHILEKFQTRQYFLWQELSTAPSFILNLKLWLVHTAHDKNARHKVNEQGQGLGLASRDILYRLSPKKKAYTFFYTTYNQGVRSVSYCLPLSQNELYQQGHPHPYQTKKKKALARNNQRCGAFVSKCVPRNAVNKDILFTDPGAPSPFHTMRQQLQHAPGGVGQTAEVTIL